MIIREMVNVQVPICKICQGALGRIMVYRKDYKGHLYFCKDCGTEYKIIGQGQAENELLMEYDNGIVHLESSKLAKDVEEKALALHRPLTISEALTTILDKEKEKEDGR